MTTTRGAAASTWGSLGVPFVIIGLANASAGNDVILKELVQASVKGVPRVSKGSPRVGWGTPRCEEETRWGTLGRGKDEAMEGLR